MTQARPRQEIEEAVNHGDLRKLLAITAMEEVIAVVETNNCFSDGLQVVTGCSFGNNALIFRDYGKTAFTLARRNGEGFRVSVLVDRVMESRQAGTMELCEKVVMQRAGSEADEKRLAVWWKELAFQLLELPDEEAFHMRGGDPVCPACSGQEYHRFSGDDISTARAGSA
jgi:formylmethanofuran dehydrogenase subunit E